MKTPDSRPRFQSATRHYHRYREENRDGWNNWVDGTRKSGKTGRGALRKWPIVAGGVLGLAVVIGVVFLKFL